MFVYQLTNEGGRKFDLALTLYTKLMKKDIFQFIATYWRYAGRNEVRNLVNGDLNNINSIGLTRKAVISVFLAPKSVLSGGL